jgi:hypothetical protein
MDKMEKINFNKLAWNAPKHGETYGYVPTDKYYNEIVEWLKTGTKKYVSKKVNGVTVSRVSFQNSEYDAIVEFIHATKMISWTFRKHNEFHI